MKRGKTSTLTILLGIVGMASTLFFTNAMTSCGKDPENPTEVENQLDYSFKLSTQTSKTEFAVGGTDKVVTSEETLGDVKNPSYVFSSQDPTVIEVDEETGEFTCVKPGKTTIIVHEEKSNVSRGIEITVKGTKAQGLFSYSGDGWEAKYDILGELEKYAQDQYLTGIPLCGDGSYVMYNERVQKGVETYIEGYGFGILQYGKLTAPLAGESIEAYKNYYHTYTSEDKHTINDWASNDSLVDDLSSYIRSGYFDAKLNEDKTDYEYYPCLAADGQENFECLDASSDASPKGTKFKLYVKTGDDGVCYGNKSSKAAYNAYDGRGVELEDYLTPFKVLLDSRNNLFRGQEMVGETYARPIKGAAEYYNATKDSTKTEAELEELFDETVGVKVGTDEGGNYITFELTTAITASSAYSNLSSSLWQPLPMDFINLVGGAANYGTFSEDGSLTPVDTCLSLSPYTLTYWEKDKLICYTRNENWFQKTEDTGMYNIEGVHLAVLERAKSDPEAAFREFLDGKLDACTIPGSYLNQYKSDPRTTAIPESTTWKVNINACSSELWEELFGENGSVTTTSKDEYWDCKPIMQNRHFLDGLYYSINRTEFADSQNFTPSQNYLSQAYYYADDEKVNHYYYETEQHEAALSNRYPSTYGYNLTASKAFFQMAISELCEEYPDLYYLGTEEDPCVIEISAKWMTTSSMTKMGEPITTYMMNAFNAVDKRIQLKINNTVAGSDSDAMYDALEYGQFDIGMGAISGMIAYPLEFMQVLCSDNRSGFCLNWGVNTSLNDGSLYHETEDDQLGFSYDALWEAGTSSTFAIDGEAVTLFDKKAAIKGVFGNPTAYRYDEEAQKMVKVTSDYDLETDMVYFQFLLQRYVLAEGVTLNKLEVYGEDYYTGTGTVGSSDFSLLFPEDNYSLVACEDVGYSKYAGYDLFFGYVPTEFNEVTDAIDIIFKFTLEYNGVEIEYQEYIYYWYTVAAFIEE